MKERGSLEDNIELYSKVMGGSVWTGLMWLRTRISGGISCEHHNEPQVFTKCWHF